MEREDAKDLTLSILVIAVAALLADCVWLHIKCAKQSEALQALTVQMDKLISPPRQSKASFSETAKKTFNKVKSAAVRGYEAAKDELKNGGDP